MNIYHSGQTLEGVPLENPVEGFSLRTSTSPQRLRVQSLSQPTGVIKYADGMHPEKA